MLGSVGKVNHLTIVIDNNLWQGKVGDSLRNIIAQPVLGLPQDENQFSVTQIPSKTFGKLFKSNRNILFIGINKKPGYGIKKDVYASPQLTMSIFGKDKASLIEQINAHRKEIISVFKKSDLVMYQHKITKKHWSFESIKTLSNLQIELKIPKDDYSLVDDTGNFLWFRKDISKGNTSNILAYSLPLIDIDSIENNIVISRDIIGKKHIPGPTDGSYMITETYFAPYTKEIQLSNNLAFETRGKWEVKNDFMAGPFLNYTVVDKANNRLLVVEGFTYAPSINKRDYMFELEAILKTLKI